MFLYRKKNFMLNSFVLFLNTFLALEQRQAYNSKKSKRYYEGQIQKLYFDYIEMNEGIQESTQVQGQANKFNVDNLGYFDSNIGQLIIQLTLLFKQSIPRDILVKLKLCNSYHVKMLIFYVKKRPCRPNDIATTCLLSISLN